MIGKLEEDSIRFESDTRGAADAANERPSRGSQDGFRQGLSSDPANDSRDKQEQSFDLQTERREEPSSRHQDYFLPCEDINREVIQHEICRYLGNDASARPYTHPDVG